MELAGRQQAVAWSIKKDLFGSSESGYPPKIGKIMILNTNMLTELWEVKTWTLQSLVELTLNVLSVPRNSTFRTSEILLKGSGQHTITKTTPRNWAMWPTPEPQKRVSVIAQEEDLFVYFQIRVCMK